MQKTVLKNGLRVIAKPLTSTNAVTVLVLAGAGSRYEQKTINGISHFLEHMFFKGAKKYKNTREVSEAIDGVGGDFNAFTTKEYVGYYIKVASRHLDLALDVLSDMMRYAAFDPSEIDKERGVIIEEYNMYQDMPSAQIGWDFEKHVFGDQPMGWDQVGEKEVIMRLTQQDFLNFKEKLYVPSNVLVSVAGNIDGDSIVKKIEQYFPLEPQEKLLKAAPLMPHRTETPLYLRTKKTEQAHLIIGFPAYPEQHKDHFALKVLGVILGGGMSSRMFMSVREAQGLAYYIGSGTEDYTDTGLLITNLGVDVKRVDKAIIAVIEEYKKIAAERVPAEELKKAKEYIKGKMTLKLEDSEEYAHLLGKREILYGETETPEEIMKKVDRVTADDVLRVAQEICDLQKIQAAMIGPYENAEPFVKLLKM